jgi:hypothetical protein
MKTILLILALTISSHSYSQSALEILGTLYLFDRIIYEIRESSKDDVQRAYEQGVRDRQRHETERRKWEAYECGYYQNCSRKHK